MNLSPDLQHVLLDIEGTTCPMNFVSEVLFPYANDHLLTYLTQHQSESSIRSLMGEIQIAWQHDTSPEAVALATAVERERSMAGGGERNDLTPAEACIYLQWLITQDRKLTPLKDLQGLIWEEGYRQGHLVAPLFADVPPALLNWQQRGLTLSVYSSGSIQAQKLLYSYSNAGDLSHLFSHWFDTRTGPKNEPKSYALIANQLQTNPSNILFISDAPAELIAARSAGVQAMFSRRPGNPYLQAEGFPPIESFANLRL